MMLGRVSQVSNKMDRSNRYNAKNRPKQFKEDDYKNQEDFPSSSRGSTGRAARAAAQNAIV